ncbi:hypothetical protein Q9L42_005520 [Methylomarinum sp. Ch1-1]|uniref:Uncharacterized protein n=1 Tax=Methylomarinum roseum TaxID=3067653 RepID=A0AAU7NX64_9GAMM|nr:hypothetical protein [Methylomarinum sp. Ch1-1]MDP4522339.1 hypothetical protein [Methylomarinum sp. Ch1-1]
MEKRTANKAKKWNNELAVQRSRRAEKEKQNNQEPASGEYIPRRYVEPTYSETETTARNNERLLLYFFIGVIVCMIVWKGFDVIKERYWMNELETSSKALLSSLEKENRKVTGEVRRITPSYKPKSANNYRIKTQDSFKGSICKDHVKTELYERKTLRCNKITHRCTTIGTTSYGKEGIC